MKKDVIYKAPTCIVIGVEAEGILCESMRYSDTSEKFEEYSPEW